MRELDITNGPTRNRPTCLGEIDALRLYPEDAASREQAIASIRLDYERSISEEKDVFSDPPSKLLQHDAYAHQKSAGQRTSVGNMVFAMIALSDNGEVASLKKAARIVSEFNLKLGKVRTETLAFGNSKTTVKYRNHNLVGDPNTLEAFFRKNRSVAHFHAANNLMLHVAPLSEGGATQAQVATLIATIHFLLNKLHQAIDCSEWNSWTIRAVFDERLRAAPCMCPSPFSIEKLMESHWSANNDL